MKLALTIATLVASTVSAMEQAYIQVDCSGIDHDSLSVKALSFSAKALEATFNAANKRNGGHLSEVSSTGSITKDTNVVSNKLRGGCNFCDDDLFQAALTYSADLDDGCNCTYLVCFTCCSFYRMLLTLGKHNYCTVCDDKLVESPEMRNDWEAAFARTIASGPFAAFHQASKCSIKTGSIENKVNKDTEVPVTVGIMCQNLDLGDISGRALAFSSKALTDTYNSVYQAVDGSMLHSMVMSGHYSRANVGEGCNFCDDELFDSSISFTAMVAMSGHASDESVGEGCNFCDDALFKDAHKAKAAKLGLGDSIGESCNFCDDELFDLSMSVTAKAWESLFLSRLLLDPKSEFKNAKHCSIVMKHTEEARMVQVQS
jgi:hypothetical protein